MNVRWLLQQCGIAEDKQSLQKTRNQEPSNCPGSQSLNPSLEEMGTYILAALKFCLRRRSPLFVEQYFYKWQRAGQDDTMARPYICPISLVFVRLAAVSSDVLRPGEVHAERIDLMGR